ncbi:MAG: pyruvate kinase [Phycisphaerae bacterium]|nr:pyruvate kinase [Phycisphaerae bacterium]
MIRTKLIATVGPACDNDAVLGQMIDAGVNVFRLNFSHGTLDAHAASLGRIRRLAIHRGAMIAVLGDLCGPKIRLGKIAAGKCELVVGQEVTFQRAEIEGTPQRLWSGYASLIDDVQEGHRVLIDDGNVRLRAIGKQKDELVCRCEVGGMISDRKGINLPDSKVSAPALTEKDRGDLDWAVAHDLDWVALSFVRQPEDLRQLRAILKQRRSGLRIMAKLEKPEALEHVDEIIALSDGVMVARGDLGVEMDLARVPVIQKEIALHGQHDGKPVVIATQMLQSMVASPVPTRAEVSDVANAILDRGDAVMLSAETSVGQFPVEAVRMMGRIAEQTESFGQRRGQELGINLTTSLPVATAIVRGTAVVAREMKPPLVALWTPSGETATLLSKHRLEAPIVALSPDERVCRQMALLYGVIPIHMDLCQGFRAMLSQLDEVLLQRGLAAKRDRIVVVADTRPDVADEIDAVFIHLVCSTAPEARTA